MDFIIFFGVFFAVMFAWWLSGLIPTDSKGEKLAKKFKKLEPWQQAIFLEESKLVYRWQYDFEKHKADSLLNTIKGKGEGSRVKPEPKKEEEETPCAIKEFLDITF